MNGDIHDKKPIVKKYGKSVLCRRNSQSKSPWMENGVHVLTAQMLICALGATWTESGQSEMGWRGRKGPAQQGFLNHGGVRILFCDRKPLEVFSRVLAWWDIQFLKITAVERMGCMWGEGWEGKNGRLKWSSKELIMSWTRVAASQDN